MARRWARWLFPGPARVESMDAPIGTRACSHSPPTRCRIRSTGIAASTGARTLWYRDAVPFEPEHFETEQVWYPQRMKAQLLVTGKIGVQRLQQLIHAGGAPVVNVMPDGRESVRYGPRACPH